MIMYYLATYFCYYFCLYLFFFFFFSSRRRHTRCALVTGVQTCALPIWDVLGDPTRWGLDGAAAAAFLALLWPRLKQRQAQAIGVVAAVVAAITIPIAPAGVPVLAAAAVTAGMRSEEHTSDLQSLMRTSYAVFCLQKQKKQQPHTP